MRTLMAEEALVSRVVTFSKTRNLNRKADDSHQILNRDQRPQDGPDSQSLTLSSLDQLQETKAWFIYEDIFS